MTPCLPCSFGLLPHPRSGSWSPAQRSSRVTVTARCIPLVTAALWLAGGTAGGKEEPRAGRGRFPPRVEGEERARPVLGDHPLVARAWRARGSRVGGCELHRGEPL